uniref:K Homology domain-containing protein n=1 Tax=Chromera velia CCMP2878 TaxID=1169474 RepID=A0A0G4HFE2_9ALVE
MSGNYEDNGDYDGKEKGTFNMKMLIDKSSAGIVIGKGGSVISSIERSTGCSLQISPVHLVFPGTNERILLLNGTPTTVSAGVLAVLEKIWAYNAEQMEPAVPCRFAVPSSGAAAIIGKGGSKIQSLQSETGTQIKVSERQDGVSERLVSVNGSVPAVREVAARIVDIVKDDPHLNGGSPAGRGGGGFANFGGGVGGPGMMHGGGNFGGPFMPGGILPGAAVSTHCEIEMHVPDDITGYVLGKKGSFLQHIIQSTRASIRVSSKGDVVPGTEKRRFTISGPLNAVQTAHAALVMRMAEGKAERERELGGGSGRNGRGPGGGRRHRDNAE